MYMQGLIFWVTGMPSRAHSCYKSGRSSVIIIHSSADYMPCVELFCCVDMTALSNGDIELKLKMEGI